MPPILQVYCCYLLRSLSSPRSTYIGFTTDPLKRLRQHNGELCAGARRTHARRPWEMVAVVVGFPTHVSALQFEWAWQHPRASRVARDATRGLWSGVGAGAKLRILFALLDLPPWREAALHLRYTTTEHAASAATLGSSPPARVDVSAGPLSDLWVYTDARVLLEAQKAASKAARAAARRAKNAAADCAAAVAKGDDDETEDEVAPAAASLLAASVARERSRERTRKRRRVTMHRMSVSRAGGGAGREEEVIVIDDSCSDSVSGSGSESDGETGQGRSGGVTAGRAHSGGATFCGDDSVFGMQLSTATGSAGVCGAVAGGVGGSGDARGEKYGFDDAAFDGAPLDRGLDDGSDEQSVQSVEDRGDVHGGDVGGYGDTAAAVSPLPLLARLDAARAAAVAKGLCTTCSDTIRGGFVSCTSCRARGHPTCWADWFVRAQNRARRNDGGAVDAGRPLRIVPDATAVLCPGGCTKELAWSDLAAAARGRL